LKPRVLLVVVVEALLEGPTAGSRRCHSSGGEDNPPGHVLLALADEDVLLRFLAVLDKVA
jgi:hypothetical protein